MPKYHGRSKRKETGGRHKSHRKKRKHELGKENIPTEIGDRRIRQVRTRGGNRKLRARRIEEANVTNPETGETYRVKIEDVTGNEANPHYVRRNIITKGGIIETEKGRARVTSRPGQRGVVNAILLEGE